MRMNAIPSVSVSFKKPALSDRTSIDTAWSSRGVPSESSPSTTVICSSLSASRVSESCSGSGCGPLAQPLGLPWYIPGFVIPRTSASSVLDADTGRGGANRSGLIDWRWGGLPVGDAWMPFACSSAAGTTHQHRL